MAKNIEPKLRKIGDYLKLEEDSIFVIPEYQRPYSWEIKTCDKLWQDIVDFSEKKIKDNYFFGTIIMSCKDNDSIYELIDGQQRTTTFLLLFKALLLRINELICKVSENDNESSALLRGLKDRRKTILSILYKAEAEEISEKPNLNEDSKLYQQLNLLKNNSLNEDNEYKKELTKILQAVDFDDAKNNVFRIKHKQKDNVYTNFFKNFKFFYEQLQELDSSQVNNIAKTIIEKCEVIEIKSWDVEQAITMFNSLNSDGMPLSDADIISAKLFASSKTLQKEDDFSQTWNSLLDNVKSLSAAGVLDIDSILNQYMYLKRAKNKEIVSASGSIDVTVPGVRRYFEDKRSGLIESNPIETCSEMLSLAEVWNTVSDYPIIKILLKCNENSKLFLGCYFNRFINNKNNIVESEVNLLTETMLRLFIILELVDAGYSSKNFKTFLFKESVKLTDINIPIEEIVKDFNSHIEENWKLKDIKDEIYDYDKNLLVYLNEYLFAKENNLHFTLTTKHDIEHIMPASGHNLQAIRKDAGIKDKEEFSGIVNKLGNKILLEQKINRSLGNEWFRSKIADNDTKQFSYAKSTYPIAKSLVEKYKSIDKPYWNKTDIENATKEAVKRISKFIFENS